MESNLHVSSSMSPLPPGPHPASERWTAVLRRVFCCVCCVVGGAVPAPADSGSQDVRATLVELQLSSRPAEALALVEEVLEEDPETARRLGLDYLRGHLLLALDRRKEALEAFATTMNATPALGPYSRFRMAEEQERLGHPEVAAGLLAALLRSSPPRALTLPAARLLRRTLDAGGDCGVLRGVEPLQFRRSERRELQQAQAACRQRDGADGEALEIWVRLLEEKHDDPVARLAAEHIVRLGTDKLPPRVHMLVGLAFHHHREFNTAVHHLARALVQLPTATDINRREVFELRYALARSHFWEGRYQAAAGAFDALANDTADAGLKAQVLYQKGRCFELAGLWGASSSVFAQAYQTAPSGSWADSALIAHLRLQWLTGHPEPSLTSLEELLRRRRYGTASRALVFLASSDLVLGRTDRAGSWLGRAAQLRRVPTGELEYWRGRLAEAEDRTTDALAHYVRVLNDDPYHPFAVAARQRLSGAPLEAVAERKALQLATSGDARALYAAWLLREPGSAGAREVRTTLEKMLAQRTSVRSYLELEITPASAWPLWQSRLDQPEQMLLALGLFSEGSGFVLRHFPVTQPGLALTGSLALGRTGNTQRSLYVAEVLKKRVPRELPDALLPVEFRELLYPWTYGELILAEAARHDIDPHLLAAIIREESRFDPRAFSAAAARGLTQFIFSTAEKIAAQIELGPIEPRDLDRPEISIALGAAYLKHLADDLPGSLPSVVAAYNAGEPQAELWRRYCLSEEPEEYISKIAFRETRGYVQKVLTSRANYAELHPVVVERGSRPPN